MFAQSAGNTDGMICTGLQNVVAQSEGWREDERGREKESTGERQRERTRERESERERKNARDPKKEEDGVGGGERERPGSAVDHLE